MSNKPAKNIISINLNKENVVLYEVDHDTHIPVLKITVVYPEVVINNKKIAKKSVNYWLSPFRDYKFQVSGSIDGQGDWGGTEVIGLFNMVEALSSFTDFKKSNVAYGTKYIGTHSNILATTLEAFIKQAFFDFTRRIDLFDNYDGIKVNIGPLENIEYKSGGFALLDTFQFYTEMVCLYLLEKMDKNFDVDNALRNKYLELPVLDSNEVRIRKNITSCFEE